MHRDPHQLVVTELAYPLEPSAERRLSRLAVAAYSDQFGTDMAFKYPTYWNWLYGYRGRSLVLQNGDELIGHVGCIPFVATYNGQSVRGTWSVDTLVLPDHRRRGYGRRLQAAAQASSPMFASLWTSEANSRIKLSIGQDIVATLPVLLRRRCQEHSHSGDRQLSSPMPHQIEAAADRYLRGWDFSVERSAAYCAWRFCEQPNAAYRQVTSDYGLVMIRRCGPRRPTVGMIGDAFPVDTSAPTLAGLVETACAQLFSEGCEEVIFGCADPVATDLLSKESWDVVRRLHFHVPQGSVSGRVFLSLSDQDIDQYPL
jgi:hypothetical protein